MNDLHQAGLGHISAVIKMYINMAVTLNATLHIPKPCTILAPKHNDNKKIDCEHGWDLYIQLPKYVTSEDAPVPDRVSKNASLIKNDFDEIRSREAFVWQINVYTYDVRDFFRTFPTSRWCVKPARSRLPVVKTLLSHRPYLGVKIRRGDDKCDHPLCKKSTSGTSTCPTSVAHIACWWKQQNVSSTDRIMLATDERDSTYISHLKSYHNFVWVDALIRNGARNNYEVFVGVNEVLSRSSRVMLRHRSKCDTVCRDAACRYCT